MLLRRNINAFAILLENKLLHTSRKKGERTMFMRPLPRPYNILSIRLPRHPAMSCRPQNFFMTNLSHSFSISTPASLISR